ncbi:MAG: Zn-ribbon domain-containing OB-fold protein [Candidatus Rokuibacteriota bacterium]
MTYFRAVDPFPLESAEHTKLHEFYTRLADGRLCTTRCAGCGVTAWPPRGFCPECASDRFEWVELGREGVIHGFSIQETGLPAGFDAPRVFAVVKLGGHRIFAVVRDADPATVAIGQRVRLAPLRVSDDSQGTPRWLPAFVPA